MGLTVSKGSTLPPKLRLSATLDGTIINFTAATNNTTQLAAGTAGVKVYGPFMVTVRSFGTGTIVVQRSSDNGATWTAYATAPNTSNTITANGSFQFNEPARDVIVRVGFPATGGTGTPVIAIEQ